MEQTGGMKNKELMGRWVRIPCFSCSLILLVLLNPDPDPDSTIIAKKIQAFNLHPQKCMMYVPIEYWHTDNRQRI